ncbi:MAG TPA: BamA/TamA family outer membrane protein [Abditibacteriaceae bacterium]|jgi:outer membrane protein insertion porin family
MHRIRNNPTDTPTSAEPATATRFLQSNFSFLYKDRAHWAPFFLSLKAGALVSSTLVSSTLASTALFSATAVHAASAKVVVTEVAASSNVTPLTTERVSEASRKVSRAAGKELTIHGSTTLYHKPAGPNFYLSNYNDASPTAQRELNERLLDNRLLLAQEQTNQPAAAPEDPAQPPALIVPVTPDNSTPATPNPPADNNANTGTAGGNATTPTVPPVGSTPVTPETPTTPESGAIGSVAAAEGRPIADVRVVGNRVVPTETVLLQATGTRPGAAFSSRQIELDRQRIDALGFFASVQYQVFPNLADPERIDVVFTVIENRVVTGFQFQGNTQIKAEDLQKVLETKTGGVLNRNTINADVEKIQNLYRERGFFGLVSESRQLENGTVLYVVREAAVSRVDISGLKKTRETLVRRMIRTTRGNTFSAVQVRQDLNRIYDMGFFEDVSFRVADDPDAPGSVIVTIVVKEKRTGQLSLGAGFDNRSRITGFASIGESNFRGTGNRIGASIELGGRQSFELSFGDPFIGQKNASFDISIFDRTSYREPRAVEKIIDPQNPDDDDKNRSRTYEETRRGLRANFTQPFDEDRTRNFLFGVRNERAELFRIEGKDADEDGNNDRLPISSTGTIFAPSIGFLRDKRDLRLDPSRGGREQFILEKSFSVLGGTTDFTKLDVDIRRYVPLIGAAKPEDLPRLVLAGRLVYGRSFGELPAFEQYFVGGPDTVRGYGTDVQFGDNQFYTNLELRFRFNRQFQFVGFADAGGASGGRFESAKTGLLSSVGVGVRVRTPIGPIRLDIAQPLQGGNGFKTHFAIGPTF